MYKYVKPTIKEMKNILFILCLILGSDLSYGAEVKTPLNLSCQDFSWSDVEILVQPYIEDSLYTALVMQGQSSNYKVSEAARQAMNASLPPAITSILRSLIKADC